MPFDGLFLRKLTNELSVLKNGRINKIQEVSQTDFLFTIRSNFNNYNLYISVSNEFARIHLTTKNYEFPSVPKSFTMLLRKYFEGSIINDVYSYNNDRVFVIETTGYNEIGDKESLRLIVEIMGRYSNIIIVKKDTIVEAIRHTNPLESDRTILPNAQFRYLETNKIDPTQKSAIELNQIINEKIIVTPKDLTNSFNGISPAFSNIVMKSQNIGEAMYSIINAKPTPILFKNNKREDFYFYNDDFEVIKEYVTISSMLDDIYFDKALKERIKQKTNDLSQFVNHMITKLKGKLIKLDEDFEDAKRGETYKLYGELLIANSYIKEKKSTINVINYYTNENLDITLDPRYNIIDNSKIYFKKYQKSKNAIFYIEEQKKRALDELDYFNIIYSQIENSNLNDILEIQYELRELKYIPFEKDKKKKVKPKLLAYLTPDNTLIIVGKNNIQNEIVTHKLALPNEYWFHVKDAPGSHVIVRKLEELTENDIRAAANIAAYYSTYKDSSSVPVNYTKQRYIKKIPGKRSCFVSISNEKTIYIDPSKEFIDSLKITSVNY